MEQIQMLPAGDFDSGRFHEDPVEDIQRAFGGRPWFFDIGARTIHRVGLFLGLAWMLPVHQIDREAVDPINGVRITKNKMGPLFTMEFVHYDQPEDLMEAPSYRVKDHRTSVPLSKLRDIYHEVLAT